LATTGVRPATVRLSLAEERIQSVKAFGIAGVMGTLGSVPMRFSELMSTKALEKAGKLAEWQFHTGIFAFELALFGVVYRCVVRDDDNDMLKQGAVGAAALCRALSSTQWTYNTPPTKMWLELGVYFGEGVLAFGIAAAALEWAWDRGLAYRLPGIGLPQNDYYYDDGFRGGPPRYMDRTPMNGISGMPGMNGMPRRSVRDRTLRDRSMMASERFRTNRY